MARAGLKRAVAASIVDLMVKRLKAPHEDMSLGEGLTLLPGMVDESNLGALRVRHDVYASIVLTRHASVVELRAIVEAILSYFSEYPTPIISNISKIEGQLFRYTLNNRNIYRLFERRQMPPRTIAIYTDLEQRLQLDGHFWLQYGLLLRRFGRHHDALEKFEKSIEAYDNEYSKHARAHQQLILAATSERAEHRLARNLINRAEAYLLERHEHSSYQRPRIDDSEYPLTVLGHYHIDALMHIGAYEEARSNARKYFNWLEKMVRDKGLEVSRSLRERLMWMAVNGVWKRNVYKIGGIAYHKEK